MRYDLYAKINRILFGAPKRTDQAHVERLGIWAALAVFSSDALSSVAYATEEILLVLAVFGAAASAYSLPIALGIILLMFIVAASYSQTIRAHPAGGGSYIVARENLGVLPGLTAAAALLIDYILTVAVSASAGAAAVTSAIPRLRGHEELLALISIWIITYVNLRGVRESGAVFAVPTYGFIAAMYALLAAGALRALAGGWQPHVPWQAGFHLGDAVRTVGLLPLLRAFSSGCTALTGIEAISNGVPAFKKPEVENAIRTMGIERTILYTMFGGITLLAYGFNLMPREGETLLSQLARTVFGHGPLYYAVQAATMLILILAANTAFADFPRLASLIAQDGYLPRPLAWRGDQLVYRGGIFLLAVVSSALVVVFHGSTHHLIPLYAVGVFLAFTLSQTGMVVHWLRQTGTPTLWAALVHPRLKRWPTFINAVGAALSFVVMLVIAYTKFRHGAWLVVILIPLLVWYFTRVKYYYECFHRKLQELWRQRLPIDKPKRVKALVTIAGDNPVTAHTVRCARSLTPGEVTCVHVAVDPEKAERLKQRWNEKERGAPLVVLESPYRSVLAPLREYVDGLIREDPNLVVHLFVPVVVTTNVFDAYLHNGTGEQIINEFRYSRNVLVTEVPFFLDLAECPSPVPSGAPKPRHA